MIGHNDICLKSCYEFLNPIWDRTRVSADHYNMHVREVMWYLKTNLPRTLVLLLTPVDVTLADDVPQIPAVCHIARKLECPCIFKFDKQKNKQKVHKLWQSYR